MSSQTVSVKKYENRLIGYYFGDHNYKQDNVQTNMESVKCISIVYSKVCIN